MNTRTAQLLHKAFVYCWVTLLNFVVVGTLWFVSPLGSSLFTPAAVNFNMPVSAQEAPLPASAISGEPTHVTLTSLNIDLPVLEGVYDPTSQTWSLSGDKAQYATISMPINTSHGNTLIYGHNNKKVFYALRKVTPGTELVVSTNSGYTFRYSFVSEKNVAPNDLSVFKFDGPPTVTIQTCTGAWNETRGMYLFQLKGVEKS